MTPEEFSELSYGLFVHFGLYSLLARGEWVMNREQIPPEEMENILQYREEIIAKLQKLHFRFITLDLQGFRSGSYDPKQDLADADLP